MECLHKKWRIKNKEHYNRKQREWRNKNRDAYLKSHLKFHYGITLEEYNKLFEEQKGCCAICGRHQEEIGSSLCLDHDHETGKQRGLLCRKCNTLLGYAEESIEILNEAIKYLTLKSKINGS